MQGGVLSFLAFGFGFEALGWGLFAYTRWAGVGGLGLLRIGSHQGEQTGNPAIYQACQGKAGGRVRPLFLRICMILSRLQCNIFK